MRSMRGMLGRIILLLLVLAVHLALARKKKTPRPTTRDARPNVIVFISDDLRADIAPYRGDMAELTPNLVKFAERSLTFENTYVQMATCGPSRNSFLTGRRNDNLRSWNFLDSCRTRASKVITLPQMFKLAGYDTESIGKVMHNYPDIKDDGKTSWTQILLPSHKDEQACPLAPGQKEASIYCTCANETGLKCVDQQIADAAIAYLQKPARLVKPFFLGVGFRRPHLSLIVPEAFPPFDRYPFNAVPEVRTALDFDTPAGMPNVAFSVCDDVQKRIEFDNPGYLLPWTVYPDALESFYRRNYFRTVSFVDYQLGRVLDTVASIPLLAENTIMIFISDNGKALGERAHWCKNGLFDVHNRVPMIMSIPPTLDKSASSNWKGKSVSTIVELLDIFRTVASLTNVPRPQCQVEGRDLSVFFRDNPNEEAAGFASLEPYLTSDSLPADSTDLSNFTFALSQMPRCFVGNGTSRACTKYSASSFQFMGYTLKTENWRYTEWRKWIAKNYTVDWTPQGLNGVELYEHNVPGVNLPALDFDKFENRNVQLQYPEIVTKFSQLLKWIVQKSFNSYPNSCKPKK